LDDWALKELTGHYVNYRKQVSPRGELLPQHSFRLYAVCARHPHAPEILREFTAEERLAGLAPKDIEAYLKRLQKKPSPPKKSGARPNKKKSPSQAPERSHAPDWFGLAKIRVWTDRSRSSGG
jgi:hypothetical protein